MLLIVKKENQKWLSLTTFSKSMGKGDINNQSNPNEIIFPQSNTIYFFIIKNCVQLQKTIIYMDDAFIFFVDV